MRIRLLPKVLWPQLAILVRLATSQAGTDFYFEFAESPFNAGSQVAWSMPGTGGDSVTSTIVNSGRAAAISDLLFELQWPGNITFQNAILVDAKSDKILAWGYISDGPSPSSPPEHLPNPQFPVSLKGSLTITATLSQQLFPEHNDSPLFFQVSWNDSSEIVQYGTSPAWAVDSDASKATALFRSMEAAATTMLAASGVNALYPIATSPHVDPSTSPGVIPTSTSATSGTDVQSTDTPSATAELHSAKAANHGSALSTGAIVGIVVGGLAGLVILSILAGCLCIRSRRRSLDKPQNSQSHDLHTMQDLIAEKERRAETLPDTPYSEASEIIYHNHHHQPHTDLAAIGTAVTTGREEEEERQSPHAHRSVSSSAYERSSRTGSPERRDSGQVERAYSPYRDQPSIRGRGSSVGSIREGATAAGRESIDTGEEAQAGGVPANKRESGDNASTRTGTPSTGPAKFGRASTPGGAASISEQYAHLVEDGMTDDEIRRLEEEERVLDEAIEQARTESRATGR